MTVRETESCMNTLKKVAYAQGLIDESDRKNCEMLLEFHSNIDKLLLDHYRRGREDYIAMQKGELMQTFDPD